MPLKALVLNVLSLTAAFGAMVWIFQDGHLGALRHHPQRDARRERAGAPVLHRVRPVDGLRGVPGRQHPRVLARRQRGGAETRADNDESVALGIAHTGRIITAAALIMSISFAALIAAHVSFMRMFGLGLTLAVLVDATLVRMALVPAFMHVMGQWNWWAPRPLAWLHHRFGFDEGHRAAPAQTDTPASLTNASEECEPSERSSRVQNVGNASVIAGVHGVVPPYRFSQQEITDAFVEVPAFSGLRGDRPRPARQREGRRSPLHPSDGRLSVAQGLR